MSVPSSVGMSLDSRADGARCQRHHELVGIRIRPRRRTVDGLSWKCREIQWNLGFLHRPNNAGFIDHTHTGVPEQLLKGGAVEEMTEAVWSDSPPERRRERSGQQLQSHRGVCDVPHREDHSSSRRQKR